MTTITRTVIIAATLALSSICAAQVDSISKLLPTMEDTTVTLTGTAAGWKDSWKQTAPNTFYLTDATGSVRVCIWPDDLAEVPPPVADGLKKKGTPVRLVGEVAVFRERVEVHIKDGATVGLIPVAAAPRAGASPAPQVFVTPVPAPR